jgi:hypothetical protein
LGVSVGKDANGDAEVRVAPGTAVTPRGQLVCVSPLQCANLVKWLAFEKNRQAVREHLGRARAEDLRLYLVLCYRDCPTDTVPVPGEPCRTEQEATAPSRLKDDFKLELRLSPPAQTEEDALRKFIKWLNENVELTGAGGDSTGLDEFVKRLRGFARELRESSPHSPPDAAHDELPDDERDKLSDVMRDRVSGVKGSKVSEVMRVRLSEEVRDKASDAVAVKSSDAERYEMSDEVRRKLSDAESKKTVEVMRDTSRDVMRVDPADACRFFRAAFRLWVTELRPLWRPSCFAVASGCADMSKREADDDCLLLAELIVPVNSDGRLDAARDVRINEERRPFVVHLRLLQEWLMCGVFADVIAPEAVKPSKLNGGGRRPPIRPDDVPEKEPVKDEPTTVRDEPVPVRQLVTIQRAAGEKPLYRLWFHLDANEVDSPVEGAPVIALNERAVAAYGESRTEKDVAGSAEPVEMKLARSGERSNVFDVALAEHGDLTRFVINLEEVAIKQGEGSESLAEYARRRRVKFVGQEGERVTVFAPPAPYNA